MSDQIEIGTDGKKVPKTNDPDAWARTFVRIIKSSHKMELPVDSMRTWFERCLKAGYQDAVETFIQTETRVYGCHTMDAIRMKFNKPAVKTKVGSRHNTENASKAAHTPEANAKRVASRKAYFDRRQKIMELNNRSEPAKIDYWGHRK